VSVQQEEEDVRFVLLEDMKVESCQKESSIKVQDLTMM
jgi:hypothetical protein